MNWTPESGVLFVGGQEPTPAPSLVGLRKSNPPQRWETAELNLQPTFDNDI